ncbi:MAG: hypothetical protein IPM13_18275 [Phycisphaerales bacterium]|nr:hypothetical protein [Phycisphaerales bacterium]
MPSGEPTCPCPDHIQPRRSEPAAGLPAIAPPLLRVVRFRRASRALRDEGIEGWIIVEIGLVYIDCVAVRRTRSGAFTLSFPRRVDTANREHAIVRPLDDAARVAIERVVFDQLDLDEGAAP